MMTMTMMRMMDYDDDDDDDIFVVDDDDNGNDDDDIEDDVDDDDAGTDWRRCLRVRGSVRLRPCCTWSRETSVSGSSPSPAPSSTPA